MNKKEADLKAMEDYARGHISDHDRRRAVEKATKHVHRWNIKFTGTNQAIKTCVYPGCGEVQKRGWTNQRSREVMKNLEDFAQPGSELWNKTHGKNS